MLHLINIFCAIFGIRSLTNSLFFRWERWIRTQPVPRSHGVPGNATSYVKSREGLARLLVMGTLKIQLQVTEQDFGEMLDGATPASVRE